MLYYVVCAWEDDFTGFVLDYGSYPDQQRPYFTLRDARFTLAQVTKASGLEGQIFAGLETLTRTLLDQRWRRADDSVMHIERCLIDANWGQSTDVIYEFCRQSSHPTIVMPSHGKFVGASSRPLTERDKRPGERIGWHWFIPLAREKRGIQHIVYDTNFWKSFVHARLAVALGDPGCLSLFGDKPERHRLFADHLCAEYRGRVEARGRTVDDWKIRAEHGDNHWFDCLVGCAVGASMHGNNIDGVAPLKQPQVKKRVSFAEQYYKKKQERERGLRRGPGHDLPRSPYPGDDPCRSAQAPGPRGPDATGPTGPRTGTARIRPAGRVQVRLLAGYGADVLRSRDRQREQ